MIQIAVVNESTVVSDADVRAAAVALQSQVSHDFYPLWRIPAALYVIPKTATPPPSFWQLIVFDDSDQADALGYHDLTAAGLPIGKVFARSDIQAGTSWTVTASHELLEMLVDPYINLAAESDSAAGSITMYAYEVSDAVEADVLGYTGVGGVLLSDFVLPAWFQPAVPAPYSFRRNVAAPFALAPGGYISILSVGSGAGWTQITARHGGSIVRGGPVAPRGSRRQRRATARHLWRRSLR